MKRFMYIVYIVVIGIFILSGGFTGCAAIRTNIKDIATQDAASAATTRIVAKQIASTWPLNSGFLTPALDTLKGLLPCNCQDDIEALDAVAAKCGKRDANGILTCEELTDSDMGQTVWLWAKVWGEITKSGADKIMQTFFPAVLARIMPYVTALGL